MVDRGPRMSCKAVIRVYLMLKIVSLGMYRPISVNFCHKTVLQNTSAWEVYKNQKYIRRSKFLFPCGIKFIIRPVLFFEIFVTDYNFGELR